MGHPRIVVVDAKFGCSGLTESCRPSGALNARALYLHGLQGFPELL